jgi:branched-chain amino acid transport system substrate-binding protein
MLHHANRRRWIQGTATALGTAAVAPRLFAQGAPVRVGYAIARTGPWTAARRSARSPTTSCGPSSRTPPAAWT